MESAASMPVEEPDGLADAVRIGRPAGLPKEQPYWSVVRNRIAGGEFGDVVIDAHAAAFRSCHDPLQPAVTLLAHRPTERHLRHDEFRHGRELKHHDQLGMERSGVRVHVIVEQCLHDACRQRQHVQVGQRARSILEVFSGTTRFACGHLEGERGQTTGRGQDVFEHLGAVAIVDPRQVDVRRPAVSMSVMPRSWRPRGGPTRRSSVSVDNRCRDGFVERD